MAPREVYEQQFGIRLHALLDGFYRGDVAIDDLGLVSYERPTSSYILDVYGLASPEASLQANKTAPWLHSIVQRHHVPLAMIYPAWFAIPDAWVPLARMCLSQPNRVLAQRCVVF